MAKLTHIDDDGNAVMVDVSGKDRTERTATAAGSVYMMPETLKLIMEGGVKKGDVLTVAQVAGIMGAKKTRRSDPALPSAGVEFGDGGTELRSGPQRRRHLRHM